MFTNSQQLGLLGRFQVNEIRQYLYDTGLVDPTTNAAINPKGIYDAAVYYGVSGPEIDSALGWPYGTADSWVAAQGLPALKPSDFVPDRETRIREDLISSGIINSNWEVVKDVAMYQYMSDNDISYSEIEFVFSWPSGSVRANTYPRARTVTVVHTNTDGTTTTEVVKPVETYTPPVTNPVPPPVSTPPTRSVTTPITVTTSPGGVRTYTPVNQPPVNTPVAVPAPINLTIPRTPVVPSSETEDSKMPLILGIGAIIAATLLG